VLLGWGRRRRPRAPVRNGLRAGAAVRGEDGEENRGARRGRDTAREMKLKNFHVEGNKSARRFIRDHLSFKKKN
jgi:hypothetical protein